MNVNVPLSNMRAIVIVIVVAFHSALAYLASQPAVPFAFDAPPYRWIAFPILDRQRWFGFDLFCAWQDVSLMALMFFLAGLFVPASLVRKGSPRYLRDRWWRIGLPFVLAAAALSPIAYYASYRATASDPTPGAFWEHWLMLPQWPAGPAWFLWQLFVLCALAAAIHAIAPQTIAKLGRFADILADHPFAFVLGLTALAMVAYVPLALAFTPWDWKFLGPFSLQLSRPLHYTLYFFAAFAIGCGGIDRGILRSDGALARHWPALLLAAVVCFGVWGELTSLTMPDWNASPLLDRFGAALAYPAACATGVLFLLALCLRSMGMRRHFLDSLSANAFTIYLLHDSVVVWSQYALLGVDLHPIAKWTIVFVGGLALCWAASAALRVCGSWLSDLAGKGSLVDQPR